MHHKKLRIGKKGDATLVIFFIKIIIAVIAIMVVTGFINKLYGATAKDADKETMKSFERLYSMMNSKISSSELDASDRATLYLKGTNYIILMFFKGTKELKCPETKNHVAVTLEKPNDCGFDSSCICLYTTEGNRAMKSVKCEAFDKTKDFDLKDFQLNSDGCWIGQSSTPTVTDFYSVIVAKHYKTVNNVLDKAIYVWQDTEANRAKDESLSKQTCAVDNTLCSGQKVDNQLTGILWYQKILDACKKQDGTLVLNAECKFNANLNKCELNCGNGDNEFVCDPDEISSCTDYTQYTSSAGTFTGTYMSKDSPAYWACTNDKLICNTNGAKGCGAKELAYWYCEEPDINTCLQHLNTVLASPIVDSCAVEKLVKTTYGYAIRYSEGDVTINNVKKKCSQVMIENRFMMTDKIYVWNENDHSALLNDKNTLWYCGVYTLDNGGILLISGFKHEAKCLDVVTKYLTPAYECLDKP